MPNQFLLGDDTGERLQWFIEQYVQDSTRNQSVINVLTDMREIELKLKAVGVRDMLIYACLGAYGINANGSYISLPTLYNQAGISIYSKEYILNVKHASLKKYVPLERPTAFKKEVLDYTVDAVSARVGYDVSGKTKSKSLFSESGKTEVIQWSQ